MRLYQNSGKRFSQNFKENGKYINYRYIEVMYVIQTHITKMNLLSIFLLRLHG